MDLRSEFYYDQFSRELGEALENSYAKEDVLLMKKLEHRLLHSLEKEHKTLFIHFVDAYRRHIMRMQAEFYMKGYFMGTEAGKIIADHSNDRGE